jgi:hypothetical protein
MSFRWLLYSSQSLLLPLYVSYNLNDNLGIMLLSMLYLTSNIHWSYPCDGLVRYIDISLVQIVLWVGLYRSQECYDDNLFTIYISLKLLAISSFIRGIVVFKRIGKKNKLYYIYYHMLLHVFGSLSSVSNTICFFRYIKN